MRMLQILRKHERWLIPLLIGLVFLVYQLTQLPNYGVTWDEPLHRNWGKLFAMFWQTGDRQFIELMPGNGKYYGPLYYLFNYWISGWLYNGGYMRFVAANHVLNVITASLGVMCTFLIGRLLGGRRVGIFAALAVVLFPMFLAHSHYNPKDMPLMISTAVTSYVFLVALRRSSWKLLLLFSLFFGFSLALKVSAVLMIPAFAVAFVLWWIHKKRGAGESIVPAMKEVGFVILLCIASILGLILAWPTTWGDLSLVREAISFFAGSDFWPGQVLFFGKEYGGAVLPWYYTPLEYLMAMPMLWIVFLVAGSWFLVRSFWKKERLVEFTFLALWIAMPMLVSMKPGLVRYDGMRQFFFVLPAFAIVMAFGFDKLYRHMVVLKGRGWWVRFIPLLVLYVLVKEVALLHPFEGSYRNELMRLAISENMDRQLQIEYWGPSYKQGMEWLVDNAKPNPEICVPTAGILVTWYPWRDDFRFNCTDNSNYVMFFTRYSEARQYAFLDIDPVFSIRRMNSDLLKIYMLK